MYIVDQIHFGKDNCSMRLDLECMVVVARRLISLTLGIALILQMYVLGHLMQ